MRAAILAVVATLALMGTSQQAEAEVPVCSLDGPNAMNKNRQLGAGEHFAITDRPLVVNLEYRPTAARPEKVGECRLPSGSKVAVDENGILVWVAKCGNDEVNRSIHVVPPTPFIPEPLGVRAPDTLIVDVRVHGQIGIKTTVEQATAATTYEPRNICGSTCRGVVLGVLITAVVAGAGYELLKGDGDNGGDPPDAHTGNAFFRGLSFSVSGLNFSH